MLTLTFRFYIRRDFICDSFFGITFAYIGVSIPRDFIDMWQAGYKRHRDMIIPGSYIPKISQTEPLLRAASGVGRFHHGLIFVLVIWGCDFRTLYGWAGSLSLPIRC